QAALEADPFALGMAAEIVVIVENEDARRRLGAPIEPGCRQPADAAADHEEVVALLDRQPLERKSPAGGQLMGDLERAGMLAAHARERRRIARALGPDLRHRGEPGGDGERDAVEKITGRNVGHRFNARARAGSAAQRLTGLAVAAAGRNAVFAAVAAAGRRAA